MNLVKRVAAAATGTVILAAVFAPVSAADPYTHLKSEIDAARNAAGCQPLQLDAVLGDISQRVAGETDAYVRHVATNFPTSGELDSRSTGSGGLLGLMRQRGYGTNNVKLLSGYADEFTGGNGDNEAKAVKAAVLEGLDTAALSDCTTYTKYGLAAINNDSPEGFPSMPPRAYSVTAVVLAGV